MFGNSRTVLACLVLFCLLPSSAFVQERWDGPAALDDFVFDRMSFYAIGWSEDGKFAYGTVGPAEEGGYHWQWHILDLIEDKMLYVSPRWTLMDGQSPGELWELHPEWHPQLIRFSVKPASSFDAGGQIFTRGGHDYRMSYTLDRSESDRYPEGFTKNIRIDLFKNSGSGKTVYSYSPSEDEDLIEDLVLKGHILSPHENRCALVALEKTVSVDGRSRWDYRVIGAHLDVGFKAVRIQGSALSDAVLNGHYYVSRMLLSEGADPDSRDSRGYGALLIAARLGHWEILALLSGAGGKDESVDDRGRTALHYAVEKGHAESVNLLLSSGSDPDRKDGEGLSPRVMADLQGDPAIRGLF